MAILTNGSTEVIKRLIKKGININIKDKNDMTALDITNDNLKYENINKLINDYTKTNCLGLNYHINNFKLLFYLCAISSI